MRFRLPGLGFALCALTMNAAVAAEVRAGEAQRKPDRLQLDAPPGGVARRQIRALTRAELHEAIRDGFRRRGLFEFQVLAESDLQVMNPVFVTGEDPRLEVTSMACDSTGSRTWFRMRAAAEPGLLPFYVSAAGCLGGSAWLSRGQQTNSVLGTSQGNGRPLAKVRDAPRPVLVGPGQVAQLRIEGAGYRISRRVVPLEKGVLGQWVRVRCLDSRRVVKAQVGGSSLVQMIP